MGPSRSRDTLAARLRAYLVRALEIDDHTHGKGEPFRPRFFGNVVFERGQRSTQMPLWEGDTRGD